MLEQPPVTLDSYFELEVQKQFSEATYSSFDGFFFISKNSGLAFLSFLQSYTEGGRTGKRGRAQNTAGATYHPQGEISFTTV